MAKSKAAAAPAEEEGEDIKPDETIKGGKFFIKQGRGKLERLVCVNAKNQPIDPDTGQLLTQSETEDQEPDLEEMLADADGAPVANAPTAVIPESGVPDDDQETS